MNIDKCILTGIRLKPENLMPQQSEVIEYLLEETGHVKMHSVVYFGKCNLKLESLDFPNYIIAGICKNLTINNLPPILIDTPFLIDGYKQFNPPLIFKDKCKAFLNFLNENEQKGAYSLDINTGINYALAYASPREFNDIVEKLIDEDLITIKSQRNISSCGYLKTYNGIRLSQKANKIFKTSLFPEADEKEPRYVVSIGTMSNSIVQQGSDSSSVNLTVTQNDLSELNKFVQELNASLPKLQLTTDVRDELNAEIMALKAQISSPKPKKGIIRETLSSLKSTLISSLTNEVGQSLIDGATYLIQKYT